MEKQVIFRDQQEFQASDPNNLQTFAADSIQHVVNDAVSAGLHYTGLTVTAQGSNTAVDVAVGRFFNAGQVFASDQITALDLFQHLPLTTQKIVAVVVWGQGVDTDIQPRDFLIDLAAGTTQPQAVAMQRLNQAVVNAVPGVESASPQAPTFQSGTIAVALITLDPTGITNITMQSDNQLPNMADHAQRIKQQEVWKGQAEPKIASITTDLAALADQSENMAKAQSLVDLEEAVARLNEQLNMPASFAVADADNFSDSSKSDTAHAGYTALVDGGGVLFPYASNALAAVDTFNPTDPTVTRTAAGMIFPAYSDALVFAMVGYAGDLSISQYQSQAVAIRRRSLSQSRMHYGLSWQRVKHYANTHNRLASDDRTLAYEYDPQLGYRRVISRGILSESHNINPHLSDASTTTLNGSIVAQTILSGSDLWVTQIGLYFTAIGATGDVHLVICETFGGKPNLDQVITDTTIPQADLKLYPTETLVAVPPMLITRGKRYAVVLITQGAHRVALVSSGSGQVNGVLFNGQDGDYSVADASNVMSFNAYAAKFSNPRTEVMLQSVTLAGGVTDLDFNFQSLVPSGAEIGFEMQVGGIWYSMDDGSNHLSGAPAIVPLRAVFQGTDYVSPALQTGADLITASKPALAYEHWSVANTLAAASTGFQVDLIVGNSFDATTDTCVASIESGGVSNAATLVETLPQANGSIMLRFHFTTAAITTYQIKILSTLGAASIPFEIFSRTAVAL